VATTRRRLITAIILATATVTLVLAVPPLRGVAEQIEHMRLLGYARLRGRPTVSELPSSATPQAAEAAVTP
jgi:hypothetical protein